MIRIITFTIVYVGLSLSASAQSKSDTPDTLGTSDPPILAVGDSCPQLKVEKFLKGDPIDEFKRGNVYVVEFWARWCGPCIQAMPHLSSLQASYKDRAVTIIGVNIRELRRSGPGWEEAFDESTRKEVEAFVRMQGDRMGFTVAYDGGSKAMDKGWMPENAGIPMAFIVDRSGKIAWFGHPAVIRMPLNEVVEGTWDIRSGPGRVKEAEDAYIAAMQMISKSGKDGIEAWEKAERDYPILARDLIQKKFDTLISEGLCEAAFEAGEVYLSEAASLKDTRALNSIAWSIVDPKSKLAKRDLDLAMRAARKCRQLTNGEDPNILATLARVHYCRGQIEEAIKLQTRAIEVSEEPMTQRLQATLDEFIESKK